MDLPGYGYAKAAKTDRKAWAQLMEDYFHLTQPRPRVFQLVDSKVGATPLDVQAIDYLRSLGDPPAVVATKIDRVSRGKRRAQLDEIREALMLPDTTPLIPFSAPSGEGVKEIWKEIHAYLRATAERPN